MFDAILLVHSGTYLMNRTRAISPRYLLLAYCTLMVITSSIGASGNCRYHLTSSTKGKYCQGNGKTMPNVLSRQCRYICMQSSNCVATNYNTADGMCTLLTTTCPLAKSDSDIEFSIFMPPAEADQCYEWRPSESSDWGRTVVIKSYVVRILKSGTAYVGYWGRAESTCRASDGTSAMSSKSDGLACQILWIKDGCTAYQHPYTFGDALPRRAVVGGIMPDGKTTYVAFYMKSGKLNNGYYIEGATYVQGSDNTYSTTIRILAIFWLYNNKRLTFLGFDFQLKSFSRMSYL